MKKSKLTVLLKAGAFAVFIIIAAAIAVTFIARRRIAPAKTPSNTGPTALGPKMVTVANNFTWRNGEAGKDLYQVSANKDQAFEDGHHELEGVRVEYYGKNTDKNDVIMADHAVYDQANGLVDFTDNVSVTMTDGATIKTDSAHFDQTKKIITSDSVVHFDRQGLAGSFRGVFFDIAATKLLMKNDVNIHLPVRDHSEKGINEPIAIRAANGEYEKSSGQMQFNGKVNVERGGDLMNADKMTAFLSGQNKITRLEARGDSYMKLAQTGKSFEVKSRDLDFAFDDHQQMENAVATGGVTATSLDDGPKRTFTGDSMNVKFAPGPQGAVIKQMTSDGRTTINLGASKTAKGAADKELVANKVVVDFHDGSKDLSHAEAIGDAVLTVNPIVKEPKAERKRFRANRFTVDFYDAGNAIRQCNGDGNVKVEFEPLEGDKPGRTTTSQTMTANFDRATQNVTEVVQDGAFKYVEGEKNATAKRATYTLADNTIRLTGNEPTVWDSAARTQAEEIVINTETGKGEAHRRVRTTYYNREKTGNAAPFGNMRAPIFITANDVEIGNKGKTVVYTGSARAWQEQNFVAADRISMTQDDKQMNAEGHVSSAISQLKRKMTGSKEKEVVPVFAKSAKMFYSDSSRRIHYEGNVDVKQGSDTMKSQTLDIFLTKATNEVDRIVAETGVSMTQPGRRGWGDKIEYSASADTLVLTGNLAKIEDDQRGQTTGRQLTLHMSDDSILVEDQRGTRRGHAVHKSQ